MKPKTEQNMVLCRRGFYRWFASAFAAMHPTSIISWQAHVFELCRHAQHLPPQFEIDGPVVANPRRQPPSAIDCGPAPRFAKNPPYYIRDEAHNRCVASWRPHLPFAICCRARNGLLKRSEPRAELLGYSGGLSLEAAKLRRPPN